MGTKRIPIECASRVKHALSNMQYIQLLPVFGAWNRERELPRVNIKPEFNEQSRSLGWQLPGVLR